MRECDRSGDGLLHLTDTNAPISLRAIPKPLSAGCNIPTREIEYSYRRVGGDPRQPRREAMDESYSDGVDKLRQFIAGDSETLLRILHCYVRRMGLADGVNANTTAAELLSETTVQALEHAEQFDRSRQPRAWLL